jgi:lipid-A-disaccharide synthase
MSDPQIFISAGEASGEHYGAMLLSVLQQRLKAQNRRATFYGMGGQRMADAGLERIVRSEDMAVMGITEVIRHLPRIYREFRKLKRSIHERRPSVAVLIDFPDIHFKLAQELHRLGVPVIFFVSPQLWAWKKHRIKLVQKYIDKMLVIFPFEEKFYRDHGVKAEFVGHPLADTPLPDMSREYFAMCNYLRKDHTWIGLLPGSRAKEIRDNLPEMLAAARLLVQRSAACCPSPEFDFVLPLAPTLTSAQRKAVFEVITRQGKGLTIRTTDDATGALFHARASIVASGTATVEAALMGNPFVVVYHVSPLTYAIAKRVVTVPHVAMANLIAGRRMVPELIQSDFTAANIVQHLDPLLPDGPPRESMKQELQQMRGQLSTKPAGHGDSNGAIDRVATITLESIGLPSVIPQSVQS